jgi:hypothetical protein
MAIFTHDGPGDWRQFILREHIAPLSNDEQRRAFLKEQYEFESFKNQQAYLQSNSLNSLNNQLHQGGNISNGVKSIAFGSTLESISQNITYIDVVFDNSVSIEGAGVPFINVVNNQVGGGTVTPVPYTYSTGANSTRLRFIHNHPSTPNNDGGISANVILVGTDLAGSATGTISGGAANNYNGVPFTGAGSDIVADVILDGGGVLSNITFVSQVTAAYDFKPGDTLTITAAAIGLHSIGSYGIDKIDARTEQLVISSPIVNEQMISVVKEQAYGAIEVSLDRRYISSEIRSLKLELRLIQSAIRDFNYIESERTLSPSERGELEELKADRKLIKQDIKDLESDLNGLA